MTGMWKGPLCGLMEVIQHIEDGAREIQIMVEQEKTVCSLLAATLKTGRALPWLNLSALHVGKCRVRRFAYLLNMVFCWFVPWYSAAHKL